MFYVAQIVQFIDGISYTKKISLESGISLELVRKALQHLLYFGFIKIVDVFQYSNFYAATPQIARLAENEDMQRFVNLPCCDCVTKTKGMPQVHHGAGYYTVANRRGAQQL